MDHKYFHDIENRKIYCVPREPIVQEQTDRSGRKIIGWSVSALIDTVRADNYLENGKWKYTRTEPWKQSFENIGNRYTKESVIHYFYDNQLVGCEQISLEEYESLRGVYDSEGSHRPQ
jgi:hypothetical protein